MTDDVEGVIPTNPNSEGRAGRRSCVRFAGLVTLVLATLLGCGSKTDDEIWVERIHSSPVYSYAALKILIAEPERDDDVRSARALLNELAADPVPNAAPDPAESARRAFTLGRALWKLRDLGKSEVDKGRESKLLVFAPVGSPAAAMISPETEHGLILFLLLMSKLDARSPAPVPPEVMLYEAYMAGTTPVPDALIASIVLSSQTAVTAEAQLCDVAGRFSDQLIQLSNDVDSGQARSLLVNALLATGVKNETTQQLWLQQMISTLPWGLRLLAHGRAAICFDGRKQGERARVEWERVVKLAGDAGIPEADLALIQAYAAYRAEDWPQTRIHLQRASSSELLTPEERGKVLQMAERFDEKDPGAFESMFDKAFVARTLLGIVDQRLQKAGVYDRLLQLPEVARVRRALNALSDPTASVESSGLWQTIRGLWSSEVSK
jgi:hypothetical protein